MARSDWEQADTVLRALLADTLGIDPERVARFDAETPLFGAIPELDSMAVATLLTAMEERLAILIDDDDIDAEDFASFGTLLAFVRRKVLR